MSSSTKTAKGSAGPLQRLKYVDEAISLPVFRLSLPISFEFLLSLPGNLMGPPALQFVAPTWIFLITAQDADGIQAQSETQQWQRLILAVTLTAVFLLLPFVFFLRGNLRMLSHVLYPNASFALSPLVGTAMSFAAGPTPHASAVGYHSIILYCLSCVVILYLKHWSRRLRPCVTFHHCIDKKHFAIIPNILAKHSSFTSFPSGDAMGATAFCGVPLMHLGYPKLATVLVGLVAFGRMFFLAHHLGDTLGGIAICASIHAAMEYFDSLPSIGTATWHHPLMALFALVVASLFRKGDQK